MIDYMVMEAVAVKAAQEEAEAAKAQKNKEWQQNKEGLERLKQVAGNQ